MTVSPKTVLGESHEASSQRYELAGLTDRFARNTLLLNYVGHGRKVLELGCSTGYMSAELQRAGCQVWGVELDENAAESARQFCRQVVVADLARPGWEDEITRQAFDVIMLADVLEHLPDPDEVLHRALQLLAPGGQIVISLPNVVHWTQRVEVLFGRFNYVSAGLLDFTHLRFFTLKTARSLIEAAGCDIVTFCPVIGGRLTGHFRGTWNALAHLFPGLFAYQLLFVAAPAAGRSFPN
jgi:2-polyprenyl-3-methyl-5-hydroxy-6-metoxy-1,4-benzoquinol methylase